VAKEKQSEEQVSSPPQPPEKAHVPAMSEQPETLPPDQATHCTVPCGWPKYGPCLTSISGPANAFRVPWTTQSTSGPFRGRIAGWKHDYASLGGVSL
jgi:hypothetical protein